MSWKSLPGRIPSHPLVKGDCWEIRYVSLQKVFHLPFHITNCIDNGVRIFPGRYNGLKCTFRDFLGKTNNFSQCARTKDTLELVYPPYCPSSLSFYDGRQGWSGGNLTGWERPGLVTNQVRIASNHMRSGGKKRTVLNTARQRTTQTCVLGW